MMTTALVQLAKRIVPPWGRRAVRRMLHYTAQSPRIYSSAEVWTDSGRPDCETGWRDDAIPAQQLQAFAPLLDDLRAGRPRVDFVALSAAVAAIEIADPLIVEVGCSSGWNVEVLRNLLHRPFRYIGFDYSAAMLALGHRSYPDAHFALADAAALPMRDRSCDVALSGGVLMHVLSYRRAIEETVRIARNWCIFHTVPVLARHPTTILTKEAYGSRVVEVVFNEAELLAMFKENRLVLRHRFDNLPHNYLDSIIGEPVTAYTYLCEKI